MDIIRAIILGALFGGTLYWVGAANPKQLVSMLRLKDLSLMKIIVFGIGFASVLLAVSIGLRIFDLGHLNIKSMNLGVIIGGLIFGIGFGWVGTCPGTCVAASGTNGAKKGLVAVLGGLLGAFIFSLTYGWWKALGLFSVVDLGKMTLFNLSDKFPSVFNIGYVGLLIVGIIFMIVAYLIPLKGRQ